MKTQSNLKLTSRNAAAIIRGPPELRYQAQLDPAAGSGHRRPGQVRASPGEPVPAPGHRSSAKPNSWNSQASRSILLNQLHDSALAVNSAANLRLTRL